MAACNCHHSNKARRQHAWLTTSNSLKFLLPLLVALYASRGYWRTPPDADSTVLRLSGQRCSQEAIQQHASTLPSRNKAFPDHHQYERLVNSADELPELLFIHFKDAVAGSVLHGWEDKWISEGYYDRKRWGALEEPKIDFIYTWANGSDPEFQRTKMPYELNSTLNDRHGVWRKSHGSNRYRDWDELRFSIRSIEQHAPFRNKIQILVNAINDDKSDVIRKQTPTWLNNALLEDSLQILSQEDFFETDKLGCLPSFNSLTFENQIPNTPSTVDSVFALSDDMLLGKPHSASDIFSPLFGPMIGFKDTAWNTQAAPTEADALKFGEKPWLIFTSWMMNRRFGARPRKGMAHLGHSLSRTVMGEAMQSFPRANLYSACSRFRGDFSFQLYSWFAYIHYTIERHREVLLWSYLMLRSDANGDGYLSWNERRTVAAEIAQGQQNERDPNFRARMFDFLPKVLEDAGLQPPGLSSDVLWTSLDGPAMTQDINCTDFDINECLAPGFDQGSDSESSHNPPFSSAAIFDRVSRQQPQCGDCLLKILLHRARKGLSPLLPTSTSQRKHRDVVVKAVMRYRYVINDPDGLFAMVTDREQVDFLTQRFMQKHRIPGQLCLNDDVDTENETELRNLRHSLQKMFMHLFPKPSSFEAID